MRFFLDHDVPQEVFQVLGHWGHDAIRLRDVLPIETADPEVFRCAQEQERILISCNRNHFLALTRTAVSAHPPGSFAGLIILIRRRTRHAECGQLLRLLRRAGAAGIHGNINFA